MYDKDEHIKLIDRRVFELERVCEKQIARIKELEDGTCRFNCRTAKEAFIAGYTMYSDADDTTAEEAYKEWRSEQ